MSLTEQHLFTPLIIANEPTVFCNECGRLKKYHEDPKLIDKWLKWAGLSKPTTGAAVFFTLWVKYPKLLYINYMENAKLLAWWLDVEDEHREFDGMDGYCINQLSSITNYSSARVIEELYRAVNRLKERSTKDV